MKKTGSLLKTVLFLALTAGLVNFPVLSLAGPGQMTDAALLKRILSLEKLTADSLEDRLLSQIYSFGAELVRTRILVSDGVVVAAYERGPNWRTRPYFAVDYNPDHYVYLEDIVPGLQDDLAGTRFWASIVRTFPDRQLMFEIALPEDVFRRLKPGQAVALTCELATVIRGGKSVYGRLLSIRLLE